MESNCRWMLSVSTSRCGLIGGRWSSEIGVLDRSHLRWARPVRVQLVRFPRTQQRRSKKDCVLPFFAQVGCG